MIQEVLNGSLLGHEGLHEEAEHGKHGQTSVLDLLHLQLGKGVWIISKTQRIKGLTGVELVQTLAQGSTIHTVRLSKTHEHNLGSQGVDDALGMDEAWVSQVVQTIISENLSTSLPPDRLTELNTSELGKELGGEASKSAKHGPTGMDELQLAVGCELLGVSGESGCVPAIISGVLSLQVGRGRTLRERSKVLGTVGSVELDCGLRDLLGSL